MKGRKVWTGKVVFCVIAVVVVVVVVSMEGNIVLPLPLLLPA